MIVEIKIPSPGESITTVELTKWLVNDEDIVEINQDIAEIDSDKATLTISSSDAGLLKILIKNGETLPIGTVIGTIDTSIIKPNTSIKKETIIADNKIEQTQKQTTMQNKAESNISVFPQALKILNENNIHIEEIINNKSKRITKKDVIDAIGLKSYNSKLINQKSANHNRNFEATKLTSLRRKLAERLVAVKNQTAMLTTFNEVDISAIIAIRKKYKELYFKQHGVKLSLMSFFTKAVCVALEKYPYCNAAIDGENIIFYKYMDICIAVSTPKGLMVPVIRNVENLTLPEIDLKIEELATKARNNKISIDEMTGGTFTITNGGVFGSLLSTPIINPPQSAILGMHNIVDRPIALNGKVKIRPMMYIALSYDHRIIDGKDSVGLIKTIKEMIENPINTIFEGKSPEEKLLNL